MIVDSNLGARPATPVMKAGKALPVIEIFGPTVQGEGRLVGTPVHFVRFGGCDYQHCSFCDTLFAVLPSEVRANAVKLTPAQVLGKLSLLGGNPEWIVFSGGNPALHDLSPLINGLHAEGRKVTIETQGSIYKRWFEDLDLLTVSPKPPSSLMKTDWEKLDRVMLTSVPTDLKIVIFTPEDREYARTVHKRYPDVPMYLSTGTFVGESTRDDLLDRMRETVEWCVVDPDMADVRHGWQLHVGLWGHRRGV